MLMRYLGCLIVCCGLLTPGSVAEETAKPVAEANDSKKQPDQEERFKAFEEMLKSSSMIGTFMMDGDEKKRRIEERYDIAKVVKQPNGDYWNFYSRIRYGDWDVTLPIPVEVKWAGTTPVITVDNLTIPAMGTFDARILIADGKYAGTWRHGKVGGLMFGRLEKQKPDAKEEPVKEQPTNKEASDAGTDPAGTE